MVIFHSYVSLPEGKQKQQWRDTPFREVYRLHLCTEQTYTKTGLGKDRKG